jgi:hypothetical protein
MPGTDARGRLGDEPFGHRVTKDGRVLISARGRLLNGGGGRQVTVVAGPKAVKLIAALGTAADQAAVQLLLAKATGNYRHGNER